MDTTIMVHITTLAVLHLNPTSEVLHLNPTLAVLRLNLAFATEPVHEEQSPVEEIEEIQVPVTQKKPTRRRQTAPKKRPQKEKAVDQRCIPWTPEEETALCKGWVRTSEDRVKGNMRNERGFWINILKYMHDTCPITQRRTNDMVNGKLKTVSPRVCTFCGVYANVVQMYTSGASDTDYLQRPLIDYLQRVLIDYQAEQEREDGKNKRYKSSGPSSFNKKDSGEGSINLNTTVGSEDENEVEEVEEVRRPRLMGRDQAKRKMKAGSTSSTSSFDVAELAKMMASEYVMASDPYNIQKKQEMSELLKIKNRELELKAAELEIRRMENPGPSAAPAGPNSNPAGPFILISTSVLNDDSIRIKLEHGYWASSRLAENTGMLTFFSNPSLYKSVFVGNGQPIPVTHTGHSLLHTPHKPLHLHHVLVTPNIIKNLISVRQFTRDNNVSVDFDAYGFSVKDYQTRRLLLHCDSTGDLYPATQQPSSTTTFALLSLSPTTWHRRLGHPSEDVLRRLESSRFISYNKTKLPALCHACQLGKHTRLPFYSSESNVGSVFDIIHSDLWTSLIHV
ncbi:ribonuclease H-like domain-containing protein [Tanacetum coccineum]